MESLIQTESVLRDMLSPTPQLQLTRSLRSLRIWILNSNTPIAFVPTFSTWKNYVIPYSCFLGMASYYSLFSSDEELWCGKWIETSAWSDQAKILCVSSRCRTKPRSHHNGTIRLVPSPAVFCVFPSRIQRQYPHKIFRLHNCPSIQKR